MSKTAKQIIIILTLLLIASIGAAFLTFNEKTQIEQASEQIRTQLQEQLRFQQEEKAQLQRDHQSLSTQYDGLHQQLNRAMQEKNKLETEIENLSARIGILTDHLEEAKTITERLNQERDDWRGRYRQAQEERDEAVVALEEKTKVIAAQKEAPPKAVAISTKDEDLESHWAGVLKEKAEMTLRISDLENALAQSSIEIEEFKKKNRELELQVSYLSTERKEIERAIERTQQMVDQISLDLVREKKDKKFMSERFGQMREENVELRSQIKELGALRVVLEKSVSQLHAEKNEMQKKLKETELIIQSRIDEVAEIKRDIDRRLRTQPAPQEITLPPIIVGGATASRKEPIGMDVPTFARGSIVNVNQENNFVIIDLGEASGIQNGDLFSVYRAAQYIGEIQVIQVRQDIAAADIKSQSKFFQVGDVVK